MIPIVEVNKWITTPAAKQSYGVSACENKIKTQDYLILELWFWQLLWLTSTEGITKRVWGSEHDSKAI